MAEAKKTTDHETIRRWVESRGGVPAHVVQTSRDDDPGLLRIDFPGRGDDAGLERIAWQQFFEKFEDQNLAFLYQERTDDGERSYFNKLVRRE